MSVGTIETIDNKTKVPPDHTISNCSMSIMSMKMHHLPFINSLFTVKPWTLLAAECPSFNMLLLLQNLLQLPLGRSRKSQVISVRHNCLFSAGLGFRTPLSVLTSQYMKHSLGLFLRYVSPPNGANNYLTILPFTIHKGWCFLRSVSK